MKYIVERRLTPKGIREFSDIGVKRPTGWHPFTNRTVHKDEALRIKNMMNEWANTPQPHGFVTGVFEFRIKGFKSVKEFMRYMSYHKSKKGL